MKFIARTVLVAIVLWGVFAAFATGVLEWSRPSANSIAHSWVSRDELRSLARYHGTDALKITDREVFIWRDGNWVPVLKNKEI